MIYQPHYQCQQCGHITHGTAAHPMNDNPTFSNGLTPAEAERLALLIEEAAEVQQIACKILRHGYESFNPDLLVNQREGFPKYTNRMELEKELGHLEYAQRLLWNSNDVDVVAINAEVQRKAETTRRWLHHQEALRERPQQ